MTKFDGEKISRAEQFIMPWGSFKGQKLIAISNSYLRWLAENCNDDSIASKADLIMHWRKKFNIEID